MIKQHFRFLWISFIAGLSLLGCQSTEQQAVMTDIETELTPAPRAGASNQPFEIPDAITNDILAGQSSSGILSPAEAHFHVVADGVAVRPFFASLVKDTSYSVIVHPDVRGTISLDLKDVTLLETLDVVREIYGFDIRKKGNIWTVKSPGLRTETIAVDYLMMTRNGNSSVQVNAGGVAAASGQQGGGAQGNQQNGNFGGGGGNFGNQQGGLGQGGMGQQSSGSNIMTYSKTDFWEDLEESLQIMLGISQGGTLEMESEREGSVLGSNSRSSSTSRRIQNRDSEGRMVIVSPMTGLVTVKAYPNEILAVKEFLQRSEQTLRRQVILEAKIVEVSLNDDFQQGINW